MKAVWRILKTAAKDWVDDNAPRLGAALSFYTVFAISPLFIIIIFIASLWFNKASIQSGLFSELAGLVGPQGAKAIQSALTASTPQDQGILASIIAVITLILSSTGLFIELQSDLNGIWGVRPKPGTGLGIWSYVKNRLLSFAMVVAIGFLLLVSLVVSAAVAAVCARLGYLVPALSILGPVLNGVISFLVIAVLFALIFKVLPDVVIAWSDVWIGAAITALLFTGGKFLLGLYLARSSTVSAYGAAGSLVLILLWVYYSSQIMFFGAELTQAYANQVGKRLRPKTHAEWAVPPSERPGAAHARDTNPGTHREQPAPGLRDHVHAARSLAPKHQK